MLGDIFQLDAAATAETAGGNVLAFILQQPLGNLPAAVQLSDHLVLRHLHIGEEGFAEGRLAGDELDRPRFNPRRRHVEQHEGNAFMLLRGVGADEAEDPVRLIGIGRPDLLAVDQEVIAFVFALRAKASQIRPSPRLRITLAPADFAFDDLRQKFLLLLLVRVFQQHRPQHPDAEGQQCRPRLDAREFLSQHLGFVFRQAAAAIFPGPCRRGPAFRAHAVEPELGVGILVFRLAPAPDGIVLERAAAAGPHRRRAVLFQPLPRFRAKILQIAHVHSHTAPSIAASNPADGKAAKRKGGRSRPFVVAA